MSETREEQERRSLRELEGKNVAYYSGLLTAWLETRMERDRTLVTLSAAAIGLLITILTTTTISPKWLITVYAGSFIGFLTTIWSALNIYELNSDHIEKAMQGCKEKSLDLERHDKISKQAFFLATILFMIIGLVSGTNKIFIGGSNMPKKETTTNTRQEVIKESFIGVERLSPSDTVKSLNGITNISPQSLQNQQTQSTQGSQISSVSTEKE